MADKKYRLSFGMSDGTTKNVEFAVPIAENEDISIPTFWDSAVNTAIERIKGLQQGKNCVTFVHFSDNHTRKGYVGKLIAKVMNECNLPYCFYNGDSVSSGYIANESIMINHVKDFNNMVSVIPKEKFCRSVGNHDGYWAVNANEKYTYTREQNYELFFRNIATSQNKTFGNDGTYYFVEDLASKIRFIVLNSNGGSFDNTQIEWLQNKALVFNETGWGVVFFSHAPITNNFHSNISNAQAVQTIISNFIEAETAEVIGWFSGHIHRDRIYQCDHTGKTEADDQTTNSLPWKTITITSDDTGIAYDNATKHTIAEDNLSHAVDFVTINRNTKQVNLTRLGIGNNRVYSYNNTILYSITNKLTNVKTNNNSISVEKGSSYNATLTVNDGYENLNVSVVMGGSNITSSSYSNGIVNISNVTGDIVITATATAIPVVPSYTNLSDPTSQDWVNNSRLSSSGTDKGEGGYPGGMVTNWIEAKQGDVIRVKGLNILDTTAGYMQVHKTDGSETDCLKPSSYSAQFPKDENGVISFTIYTISSSAAPYVDKVRFSGMMTAANINEIIITRNQEIT